MFRRTFLGALAAATPLAFAKSNKIDRSRISFITDEAVASPAESIEFAKKYGLRWVELREVPGGGGHYMRQSEQQLKEYRKQLRDNGMGVSYLNTPMFKITLPGTEPLFRRPETSEAREKRIARHQAEFDRRKADFEQAFRAAHALDVDKIRVFTFLRTAEPASLNQRIADVIGEMAEMAGKQKIKLLVENEAACNVVTCAEMAAFIKLLPEKTVGLNWDPHNGRSLKEVPFPDGYKVLPVKRVGNVQMKGHSLLDPEQKLDWAGVFDALARDGYKGQVGLETHYFDGTKIEKSHRSMVEILRIVES
jgi:sugar phosphate isomerase/epimerase